MDVPTIAKKKYKNVLYKIFHFSGIEDDFIHHSLSAHAQWRKLTGRRNAAAPHFLTISLRIFSRIIGNIFTKSFILFSCRNEFYTEPRCLSLSEIAKSDMFSISKVVQALKTKAHAFDSTEGAWGV